MSIFLLFEKVGNFSFLLFSIGDFILNLSFLSTGDIILLFIGQIELISQGLQDIFFFILLLIFCTFNIFEFSISSIGCFVSKVLFMLKFRWCTLSKDHLSDFGTSFTSNTFLLLPDFGDAIEDMILLMLPLCIIKFVSFVLFWLVFDDEIFWGIAIIKVGLL